MSLSLTVIAGFPGVGKTFIGRELADLEDATVFEADRIRKELTDGDPTYSGTESHNVYNELFTRGRNALTSGNSTILDATFGLKIGRNRANALADEFDATFRLVHVVCDEPTTKERLRHRTNSVSDAGLEIYEHIKHGFEEFDREVIEIDNSGDRASTIDQLHTTLAPSA